MSHTSIMQQMAQSQKKQICELLNIEEEQYAQMQYEAGLEYLEAYLGNDQWAIDELERSKLYWSWWKNHWVARDAQYLENNPHLLSLDERRKHYNHANNPAVLICTISPGRVILEPIYRTIKTYQL